METGTEQPVSEASQRAREAWKTRKANKAAKQKVSVPVSSSQTITLTREDLMAVVEAAVKAARGGTEEKPETPEEMEAVAAAMRQKAAAARQGESVTLTDSERRAAVANAAVIRAAPAEVAGDGRVRPGTRIAVGRDRFGDTIWGAVEWRREDIEGKLECVGEHPEGEERTYSGHVKDCYKPYPWSYSWSTFTPTELVFPNTIAPHGVKYQLSPDVEFTVPKIVKDEYDKSREARRRAARAHPPLSAEEDRKVSNAAVDSGLGISRVHRVGWGLLPPETTQE